MPLPDKVTEFLRKVEDYLDKVGEIDLRTECRTILISDNLDKLIAEGEEYERQREKDDAE